MKVIFCAILVLALSATSAPSPVRLLELTPAGAEFGTNEDGLKLIKVTGPGKLEPRCNGMFWKNSLKIIKEIEPDRQLPAGHRYYSRMQDCFAVEGEYMTGVGLWSRSRIAYHWVEYEIPKGAKKFSCTLFASDDPDNGEGSPPNQEFFFSVWIDGKEVKRFGKQRLALVIGGGGKVEDLNIVIPANATKIRFRLENSGWGDGNRNTEIIINEGVFSF